MIFQILGRTMRGLVLGFIALAAVLGYIGTKRGGGDSLWRGQSSATVAMQPEQVMAMIMTNNRYEGNEMAIASATPDTTTFEPVLLGEGGGDLPGSTVTVTTTRDEEVRFTVRTGSGAQGHVAVAITPDGTGSKLAVDGPVMGETGPEADRELLEKVMDRLFVRLARQMVRTIDETDEAAEKAAGQA